MSLSICRQSRTVYATGNMPQIANFQLSCYSQIFAISSWPSSGTRGRTLRISTAFAQCSWFSAAKCRLFAPQPSNLQIPTFTDPALLGQGFLTSVRNRRGKVASKRHTFLRRVGPVPKCLLSSRSGVSAVGLVVYGAGTTRMFDRVS